MTRYSSIAVRELPVRQLWKSAGQSAHSWCISSSTRNGGETVRLVKLGRDKGVSLSDTIVVLEHMERGSDKASADGSDQGREIDAERRVVLHEAKYFYVLNDR